MSTEIESAVGFLLTLAPILFGAWIGFEMSFPPRKRAALHVVGWAFSVTTLMFYFGVVMNQQDVMQWTHVSSPTLYAGYMLLIYIGGMALGFFVAIAFFFYCVKYVADALSQWMKD